MNDPYSICHLPQHISDDLLQFFSFIKLPGEYRVTCAREIKGAQISLPVAKINKVEVYEKNNRCNKAPGRLQDENMLILATDTENKASPILHVDIETHINAGQAILWRLIGSDGTTAYGDFLLGSPDISLVPLSLSTSYRLETAIDTNSNGIIDIGDIMLGSFTMIAIPKSAYATSYDELFGLATIGDLAQYRLASSFLLTFLGRPNDAPIKPTSKNNPNTYFLETTDGGLSHVAGAWFEPITGTDYCRANIDWYIYDNNEAADVVANSITVKDWIRSELSSAAAQGKLMPGQPHTFPYPNPTTIRFGEAPLAKASDANLALGMATHKNLTGTANMFRDQLGRICTQNVTVRGIIEDLYDFNYFDNEEFLPLSRPASILQFGWNSGLKELVSERGEIFRNTINVNKTISFEWCW